MCFKPISPRLKRPEADRIKFGNCDSAFNNSQCMDCNNDLNVSVNNVINLQQKKIDLIYENINIINFEHDVV